MGHNASMEEAARELRQHRASEEDVYPSMESLYNPKHFEVESDRDARLRACQVVDTPPERRFDTITRLMAEVFKTPVCLLTLIIDDRVWFKSKVGPFGSCVCRDGSWCNYIVVPTTPEVLITEDASVDARFSHNPYVAGDPFIKFYAGAPLVGTGGRRYGTLCVVDLKPRSFTAEMYHLLVNFAEIAVQELEKDSALLQDWSEQAVTDVKKNRRLRACLSSSVAGVAMMDTRTENWKFMFTNDPFKESTQPGVDAEILQGGLWDHFDPQDMCIEDAKVATAWAGTVTMHVTCKHTGEDLKIHLRPASSDQMAPGKPVAVPAWVPSENDPGKTKMGIDMPAIELQNRDPELCQNVEKCFYFAVIQPYDKEMDVPIMSAHSSDSNVLSIDMMSTGSMGMPVSNGSSVSSGTVSGPVSGTVSGSGSGSSGSSAEFPAASSKSYGDFTSPLEKEGLKMGPLLGSGGFGKVYRGIWKGQPVAVKVLEAQTKKKVLKGQEEAALSMSLSHQNLVGTVHYTSIKEAYQVTVKGKTLRKDLASVIWILQEYCDRGTLIDAVERGWLSKTRSIFSTPDMPKVYKTLMEVADGMAYLQTKNLLHNDLNGRNVLLQSSDTDERGFVAKVSDFGLAQICYGENTDLDLFGTISHMAPELLMDSKVHFKSDVWAFGVLMWEIYTGYRAYQGKKPANIIYLVVSGKGKLQLPEDAPPTYQEIFEECTQYEAEKRPSFTMISKLMGIALEEAVHSEVQAEI